MNRFHAASRARTPWPRALWGTAVLSVWVSAAHAGAVAPSVALEDLTSTEVRERIAHGETTVLVPIGGTEQSGPFIALGKHNERARSLSARIARDLGETLVAPVIAYVPEGNIDPPTGHMRFTGTISIPTAAFEALLEGTARSLRAHGFREVVFLGDHGGTQASEVRVAQRLNSLWRNQPGHVLALTTYYDVAQTEFVAALVARGYSRREIGEHAGLADASLMLAVDPSMVRSEAMQAAGSGAQPGVIGDAHRASAKLGEIGVDLIVNASVKAIRADLKRP